MSECQKDNFGVAYLATLLVCGLFHTANMSYIVLLHSVLRLAYFLVIQTSMVNRRSTYGQHTIT